MRRVIFRLNGGLGNQLSQIAAALDYQNKSGIIVEFDSYYLEKSKKTHEKLRAIELCRPLLNLNYAGCKVSRFINRILYKLGLKNRAFLGYKFFFDEYPLTSDLEDGVFIVVEGFWQHSRFYTDQSKEKISAWISSTDNNCPAEVLENVADEESCAIHIRRGDYLTNRHLFRKQQLVLPISYYCNAIETLCRSISIKKVYIFSDDKLNDDFDFLSSFEVIEISTLGLTDFEEFYLMSKARNIVIANSTFSMWAAILAKQFNQARVFAPNRWHLNRLDTQIIPPEFRMISIH